MSWESFDVVRFDIALPPFKVKRGQLKLKSADNSLIRVPRGLQRHTNLLEIMG